MGVRPTSHTPRKVATQASLMPGTWAMSRQQGTQIHGSNIHTTGSVFNNDEQTQCSYPNDIWIMGIPLVFPKFV